MALPQRLVPSSGPSAWAAPQPGWCAVAGAFLISMVGFGAIYSQAAFAEEIGASFGVERSLVMLAYALSGGICFFVGAVAGPLADRFGARLLAGAGMLLVGLGLMIAAAAGTLAGLYVGYGVLVGLGVGIAYVPAIAAVQRWFDTHRGLASGIAVSGIGIGTALVPVLADALQALGDWRAAFTACGALAAFVGLCGALLLRPPPVAVMDRLAPDGSPALPGALASRAFALAYAGTFLVSLPSVLPHAMLVATARDLGLPRQEAAGLLGLLGLGTIAGRFALAVLADAVGRRPVFLACCAGMATSLLVWAAASDAAALRAFALGFGALQGGFVALLPAFMTDTFGGRSVGGLLGVLYTGRGIAVLAAPPLLAFGIAALAGHAAPLIVIAALGGAGSLLLMAVRPGYAGRGAGSAAGR